MSTPPPPAAKYIRYFFHQDCVQFPPVRVYPFLHSVQSFALLHSSQLGMHRAHVLFGCGVYVVPVISLVPVVSVASVIAVVSTDGIMVAFPAVEFVE